MRPPGEISTALVQAAERLTRIDDDGQRRGPTLRELAHAAKVGMSAARRTVDNLRRAGKLEPVAQRKVAYRNRPVVEYARKVKQPEPDGETFVDVAAVFAIWSQG